MQLRVQKGIPVSTIWNLALSILVMVKSTRG